MTAKRTFLIAATLAMVLMCWCSSLYSADGGWFTKTDIGPVPFYTYKF